MLIKEQTTPPGLGFFDSSSGHHPIPDVRRKTLLQRLRQLKKMENKEPPIEKIQSRIDRFNLFAKALQSQGNIYYPGSHTDISPSAAEGFADRDITYVDQNVKVIQALHKAGYKAVLGDVHVYNPGRVDLLLLLNFYAPEALNFVIPRGYVICNKYYQDGSIFSDMLEQNNFEFIAALIRDGNGEIILDIADLDKYRQKTDRTIRKIDEDLFVFRRKEIV